MYKETKIDFQAECFDDYFGLYVNKMTSYQRSILSPTIWFRMFTKKGKQQFEKVSFFKKWFILFRVFRKRLFIVIEDEENGLGAEQFIEFKKRKKKESISIEDGEKLVGEGICVLGNNELINWLAHINNVTGGPAYNYAIKIKNEQSVAFPQISREAQYLVQLFYSYELNKPKIFRDFEIGNVDLLILLHLFDGKEKEAKSFYEESFNKYSGCGRRMTMDSFRRLESRGYITKFGITNNAGYRITDLGKQVFYEIIKKYIIP